MKILYATLKELTEEQRSFLADKYRVDRSTPIPDKEMAERYNMTQLDYMNMRKRYERLFYRQLEKALDYYKGERA
ncbi:hypothetical protein ABID56_002615 [Alkalibacillus flavidus]|uniref:ArpU family transcriptional regulator n=1 Tax=Alkalibacillus flavidus TaxID=546021 RepID=A0ABV2KY27_9BACI